jgi:hypothetical protein
MNQKYTKKMRMPSKGPPHYRLFIRRLISLSREPAALETQPRELAVPANMGQLRNQQGVRTRQQ